MHGEKQTSRNNFYIISRIPRQQKKTKQIKNKDDFRGEGAEQRKLTSGTHKHFLFINKKQVIARRWKTLSDHSCLPARPFQANSSSVKFDKTRQHPRLMSTDVS